MEDFSEDVIQKAQAGLSLTDKEITEKTDIPQSTLQALKNGDCDEEALLKLAEILQLHPPSLVELAKKAWEPQKQKIEGLLAFESPFNGMNVNAYLVWDAQTKEAALFDTGADASALLNVIKENLLLCKTVFLTHSHTDHIVDLNKVRKAWPSCAVYIHEHELVPNATGITEGSAFKIGNLTIETRKTTGHSPGGITYVIQGLEKPIAIVGDALFSASMGGPKSGHYQEALDTNRKAIFSLPDETIICPGHGPMSSVKEEKAHNPFFPEFK